MIENQAGNIQFAGKGEKTNVGTRIDSTTRGMAVDENGGISRPDFTDYYPPHSISRPAIAKEKKPPRKVKKGKEEIELQGINRQDVIAARAEQAEFLDEDPNWLLDDGMPGGLPRMPSKAAMPKVINRPQIGKKKPSRRANDSPLDTQLSRMSDWP